MIRVKCPKCQKALGLDDATAGAVAGCPGCGAKFRVPAPKGAAAAKPPVKPPAADVAKAETPYVPSPNQDFPDDFTPYGVVKEPEPPPEVKKKRRRGDDDDYDDDEEEDEEEGKLDFEVEFERRRKKRDAALMAIREPAKYLKLATRISLWLAIILAALRGLNYALGSSADPALGEDPSVYLVLGVIAGQMIFALIAATIIIMGAERMSRLEGYPFAIFTCVFSWICSPLFLCFLIVPLGIWAFVVLLRPEVKAEFH